MNLQLVVYSIAFNLSTKVKLSMNTFALAVLNIVCSGKFLSNFEK